MTLSKLGSWLAWFIPIFWRRKQRERLSCLPRWGGRPCDPNALSPLHPVPKAQNPPPHWRMNPEWLCEEGGIRRVSSQSSCQYPCLHSRCPGSEQQLRPRWCQWEGGLLKASASDLIPGKWCKPGLPRSRDPARSDHAHCCLPCLLLQGSLGARVPGWRSHQDLRSKGSWGPPLASPTRMSTITPGHCSRWTHPLLWR